MMTHLRLSGCLEGLAGLIAGDFVNCGDLDSIHRVLADNLSNRDIPIVGGLPVGHGPKNTTLPIGQSALLDTDRMRLSMMEPGTSS